MIGEEYGALCGEMADLLGPYCQDGQPRVTVHFGGSYVEEWPTQSLVEIQCALKCDAEQGLRPARAEMFAAAQGVLDAIENAGWRHFRAPVTIVGGEAVRSTDGTWGLRADGRVEMTLAWRQR
ncbi:MAG: hypothetical protein JWO75_487 [Actinomycetia bacterium]|nr:hypothetical protein [Actinomycetes bacterium]